VSDISTTLQQRGSRYGELIDNAGVAQALKKVFRAAPNWPRLAADQQEALDQIASKMSRALTGDPEYSDNWHDIAGYAKLVDERLSRAEAKLAGPFPPIVAQPDHGRQA
jgi:hypothetical protein